MQNTTDVLAELTSRLGQHPAADDVEAFIGVERIGRIAILTLARPEQHNVINLAGWHRIARACATWAADPQLRLVLLRGAGSRAFGTGADIKEFRQSRMTAEHAVAYNEAVAHALTAVASLAVPVVALIDGLAVGGGLELSAAADIRIATARSRFGIPIGRLGVTLGYTEAAAITRLIGPAALKYLLISGELLDANTAYSMGFVQRVVEDGTLSDAAEKIAANVLRSSVPTMLAGKAVADMTTRPLTAADTELLARITVEVYSGADLAEGVDAFLEGRSPVFPSLA